MKFLETWNKMVRALDALVAMPGHNTTVEWTTEGQIISAWPSSGWRHPWTTVCQWLPDDSGSGGRWVARVRPGFVNGEAPVFYVPVKDAPAATIARERETVAQGVDLSNADAQIASPLVDSPFVELAAWRSVGWDGEQTGGVPQFFAALGVGSGTDAGDALEDQPDGNRLLRACELVIFQPRPSLTVKTELGNVATGEASVIQTLSIRTPDVSERLRIMALTQMPATGSSYDPSAQLYQEEGVDQKALATVYLVSPPNAELGSNPDQTWTPYVKHHLFWNLSWDQPGSISINNNPDLTLVVPLAGGIAQPVVNSILSTINDANRTAENMLQAKPLGGSFWSV